MKFRSVFAIAALAASVSFATDVMTTDTVGWIKVTSTAKSTIVSVPWIQVGSDAASVQVAKLVKTDSLTADGGVMLYYYDGTKYWAWALTTVSNVKTWVPATIISESNGVTTNNQSPDDDYALPRGKALFVYRPNGSTDGDIYLYGKYTSAEMTAVATVANGYTLLGNPTAAEYNLNSATMTGTPNEGDRIQVPGNDGAIAVEYYYDSTTSKWGYMKAGESIIPGIPGPRSFSNEAMIPAGRGVWYKSAGGSPTFKF